MGRRGQPAIQPTQFLETVWSEPGSPVSDQPETGPYGGQNKRDTRNINNNHPRQSSHKRTSSSVYYDEALEALLRGFQTEGDCTTPGADPDQLFLLPDRVLTVDSLTFREELAAVAPTFLSPVTPTTPSGGGFGKLNANNNNGPPHSSLDSTDSNRSVRLADDTEGLIITRACNGCLWLCESIIFLV